MKQIKYKEMGKLCNCNARREAPGTDHSTSCPWYATHRVQLMKATPVKDYYDGRKQLIRARFTIVPIG